jgi:hypothetical protein
MYCPRLRFPPYGENIPALNPVSPSKPIVGMTFSSKDALNMRPGDLNVHLDSMVASV